MLSWFNVKIRAWPAHGATHDCVREQPRGSLDWEHRWALSLLPPPGRLSRRSQRKPICSAPPPAPTPSTLPKLRRAHVPASLPTPISHGSPVLHGPQCPQSPTFPFAAPAVDKSTAQNFTQSPPGNQKKVCLKKQKKVDKCCSDRVAWVTHSECDECQECVLGGNVRPEGLRASWRESWGRDYSKRGSRQ